MDLEEEVEFKWKNWMILRQAIAVIDKSVSELKKYDGCFETSRKEEYWRKKKLQASKWNLKVTNTQVKNWKN